MARIRTIKPDFFRHEGLQDLAKKHGFEVMLVFIGIWTQCDKRGCFLWSPRQLSLDILPFLKVDMKKMLDVLGQSKYVLRYTVDGKDYGFIPTFQKHQMIFGSERKYPAKFPEFCGITEDVLGSPRVDLGHWINGKMDKGNNGLMEKGESVSSSADMAFFDEARKAYPGTKRGLAAEWENFQKKYPLYAGPLLLLLPAIEREISHREKLEKTPGAFSPNWPHFKTWINDQRWTQEFGAIEGVNNGRQSASTESASRRAARKFQEQSEYFPPNFGAGGNTEILPLLPQGNS